MGMRTLVLWAHLVSAMFWVGGMAFATFVLMPALKKEGGLALITQVMPRVVARFRIMVWAAISVIVLTGLLNLYYVGVSTALLGSRWGLFFFIKMGLVAGLLVVFLMAPRLVGITLCSSCDGCAPALNEKKGVLLHVLAIALALGAVFIGLHL